MAFLKLNDAQLFYHWDGPEHAPALVFSNSLGTTHRMWDPQLEPFTRHFRVLRYDGRGHGQSSATPGPYSIEQLAGDVLRLLDTLKLERIYFCGLSMGGMIGMHLGAAHASRVHKIVLCNTAAKIGTPDVWNARITAVQAGGMKAVAGAVIDRWLTAAFRATHPGETAQVLSMLEGCDPAGYAASCCAVRDADFRQKLGGIHVPTQIIAGTHDPATPPADGRALSELIPGAKYTELPAAHLSNIEAREEFNREVLAFLKSQGAHG
ncbi:MAG TPA: 3-oxoadipate enol-lactonase [Candidatus Acidoferrum sp.]|jgi:3-oxoadipate enol-lactonase|nr:3-oxoadipate enol-lactonase [Candidatus Acidoferrum sp.]